MNGVCISVKFNPKDIWIGVYWNYHQHLPSAMRFFDVYICVIPMLPIHISREWMMKY